MAVAKQITTEAKDGASMSDFRPLRRKIGVLILATACMFTGGWLRSLTCDDFVDGWLTPNSSIHLISSNSSLTFSYAWDDGSEPNSIEIGGITVSEALMDSSKRVDWKTYPLEDSPTDFFAWTWEGGGLSFAANDYEPIHKRAVRISEVYFVASLTVLSAYLLLSAPRPATAKAPS